MTEQVQHQPQTMSDAVEALNRLSTTVLAKNADMKLMSVSAQYDDGKGCNLTAEFKQDPTNDKVDAVFTNRSEGFTRVCSVHDVSTFKEAVDKFEEEHEIFYAEEDDQPPF